MDSDDGVGNDNSCQNCRVHGVYDSQGRLLHPCFNCLISEKEWESSATYGALHGQPLNAPELFQYTYRDLGYRPEMKDQEIREYLPNRLVDAYRKYAKEMYNYETDRMWDDWDEINETDW